MRIGTWNLAGRWRDGHADLLRAQECDVWLLTEVQDGVTLPGFERHLSAASMARGRRWAAVLSRQPMEPLPDPHPASAAAVVAGLTFCSSVLPWRSAGHRDPWQGTLHADKTAAAVDDLRANLPVRDLVWGGDWNHALDGQESAGSQGGRVSVLGAVEHWDLQVPTRTLRHRLPGCLSIDHVAVPATWTVTGAERVDATGLSDHDAYVVEGSLR